jgi:hypothetical protein
MRALVLIAVAACGKSSTKSEPEPAPVAPVGPVAPVASDARVPDAPGRDALVPLAYKAATDADHAAAGSALVRYASTECTASRKAIYTAVVEHAGATLFGIDCHTDASHLIGLVRLAGARATVIAGAEIKADLARVERVLASEDQLCMQYNQFDGDRITKNLRHCVPLAALPPDPPAPDRPAPPSRPPTPPDPPTALQAWAAPDDLLAAAKVRVYEEVQTCQDATERAKEITHAVTTGERQFIAVSCGNLAKLTTGLTLFEVRGSQLVMIAYSLDANTKAIAMQRIRATETHACMDYVRLPSGNQTKLCTAIY